MWRGRSKRAAERTRVLFVTDLHASEITFRKMLNAVRVYEASVLIVGGDLTGKQLVPIVETEGGWHAHVLGETVTVGSDDALADLVTRVKNLGQYPRTMSADEFARLSADRGSLEAAFEQACLDQVEDWMARISERFGDGDVAVFVTGGNDDFMSIEPLLSGVHGVVNGEGATVELLAGVPMISTGYGNETPWHCPRDVSEHDLETRIDAMAQSLEDPERAVFNLHVPPVGSGLDSCVKLDLSVHPPRPIAGEETEAGSAAVRSAIERYQPVLSLHGHIHECRGVRQIGRTTCVNPGSEYAEGVLHGAIIDFASGQLDNIQLVSA
jgi:uncharacterized protein